jgi:hypothetical protein
MTRVGGFVGCTIGGFAPALWGGSELSLSGVMFGIVGGIMGVWLGSRFSGYF